METRLVDLGSSPAKRRPLLAASPRFADSFGLVLLLLVVSYFVIAAAGDGNPGRIASMVIFATTTWLALRAAQVKRRILRIAARPHPSGDARGHQPRCWSATTRPRRSSPGPRPCLARGGRAGGDPQRLVVDPVISLDPFYGAMCVYLLIAMFFATTYGLIALLSAAIVSVQLTEAARTRRRRSTTSTTAS